MAQAPYIAPRGWGGDTLSEYLELAYRNRHATFANKKDWYGRLAAIDDCFMRLAKDWRDPGNLVSSLLFIRAHAAYRAGAEHALAGQIADAFPELRACLEYAGYALHIAKNPSLAETWVRRHDDEATLKAVKAAFTVRSVKDTITQASAQAGRIFDMLYERAIDFGGHPNERAVTSNLAIRDREDGGKEFLQIQLHGDGIQLDHILKTTAQTGVCALEILHEVFPARFKEVGVTGLMPELRKEL